jgi:DNA primase catalytic subunit
MKKGDAVEHVGKDFGVGIVIHTYSTHRGYHVFVRWPKAKTYRHHHYEKLQKLESK